MNCAEQVSTRTVVLALALLAILSFLPLPNGDFPGFWHAFMDSGHMPAFAGLTLLFYFRSAQAQTRTLRESLLLSAITALGIALLIEIIQPYFDRSRSLDDFAAGATGTLFAIGGILLWRFTPLRLWRVSYGIACTVAALFLAIPMFLEGAALVWQRANFPLLADFESHAQLRLWHAYPQREDTTAARASLARDFSSDGTQALLVDTLPGTYSGVVYSANGFDWSPYRTLAFDIFTPEPPFDLNLRIDDDRPCTDFDDRYNAALSLRSGWNSIRIPLAQIESAPRTRLLNLRAVRRMLLFTLPQREPRVFYLAHLRLEP